jgi:hypothetical protein
LSYGTFFALFVFSFGTLLAAAMLLHLLCAHSCETPKPFGTLAFDFHRLSAVVSVCGPSPRDYIAAWFGISYSKGSKYGAEFASGQFSDFDHPGSWSRSEREFPAQRILET